MPYYDEIVLLRLGLDRWDPARRDLRPARPASRLTWLLRLRRWWVVRR